MKGRHEEGNFQKQRQGTAQGIDGLIRMKAVIGLQHHVALIALEHLVDMFDAWRHALFPLPLRFLDGVGPVIQRQQQKVEAEAQRNDGGAGIPVDNMKGDPVDDLKEELQRAKQKLIDRLQNGHLCFSP